MASTIIIATGHLRPSPFVVVPNLTPRRLAALAAVLLLFPFSVSTNPTAATTAAAFAEQERTIDAMWTHRLIFAGSNGLLFLLGLANVLVLFIVGRYRRMRTVTNILIFNLCLADLIYISFLPVVIMFQLLRDWMFGNAACKLFYIAESTAKYASVYFVCILSLDRYFALCHPHLCKRYRRPSLALLVSGVGWCVTAVLMIPIYLYSTVVGPEGERFCTVAWPNEDNFVDDSLSELSSNDSWFDGKVHCANSPVMNPFDDRCFDFLEINNRSFSNVTFPTFTPPSTQFYFITLTFIFCFGIPALVILFFYFKVLDQLFQASTRAERLKKRREKTYRKVTRMVLSVITFYVICWLPYWTQFLVVTFVQFTLSNSLKVFFNTIHLLPYLNCAVNPILYGLMTDNFRRILSELFPFARCLQCEGKSQRKTQKKSLLKQSQNIDEGLMEDHNAEENGDFASSHIGQSIRMVSEFSLNLLSVKRFSKDGHNASAESIVSTN